MTFMSLVFLLFNLVAWDKLGSDHSLSKTIIDAMGHDMEEACLLLMKDPLDIFASKIKKVLILT